MKQRVGKNEGQIVQGGAIDSHVTIDLHVSPPSSEPTHVVIGAVFAGPVHIHVTVERDDQNAK